MSSPSPLEILQSGGPPRVSLSPLGYGRVLVCAASDYDLSRNQDGITLTPFGVIFETGLRIRLQAGYTLLVASAAGSYLQVHANIVWGHDVPLLLNLALNGHSAVNPRAYREQPLAVLSLLESQTRPDLPILGPVVNLPEDDDDEGPAASSAVLMTSSLGPSNPPDVLVPATPSPPATPAAVATEEQRVPSSDPDEAEQPGATGGDAQEDDDEGNEDELWSADEGADSEEGSDSDPPDDVDSEGGEEDDDEEDGGDPLCGSAGLMGVRHRAGLYRFVVSAGDPEVSFPPRSGQSIRRLVREVELQLNEDAKTVGWQASVDCACCPYDCTFYRAHWEKSGENVVVLLALASHMFSNMPTVQLGEQVRLILEHRARVIWGGPMVVSLEVL